MSFPTSTSSERRLTAEEERDKARSIHQHESIALDAIYDCGIDAVSQ